MPEKGQAFPANGSNHKKYALLLFTNMDQSKVMKNYIFLFGRYFLPLLTRNLLIMKLIILLTILTVGQLQAAIFAQTVTLSRKNIPIVDVFREVKRQTGYTVFCKSDIIRATPR